MAEKVAMRVEVEGRMEGAPGHAFEDSDLEPALRLPGVTFRVEGGELVTPAFCMGAWWPSKDSYTWATSSRR